MPAAQPAFALADFKIAVAEPRGCCDKIPFLEVETTQDTEVFVGMATSRNSGAGIPLLDKNRSVSASKVDDTVGAPAEERSFGSLDMELDGDEVYDKA